MRMSHQTLLKNFPGVKNVIFLPLWDYIEEKMVAGCFLWTSSTGRMMNLDDDLSYLRAFGNTIMSEVSRMNALKDDRAKTTFIASMSHELRSPLHGILGSVEFLQESTTDAYQAGLVNSISTCGKTLLDTLDHVLDHAKINKLGRNRMRKDAKMNRPASATDSESLSGSAEIDLGLVVEEVVEAVCAGHAFKRMHIGELKSREGPVITMSRHSSFSKVSTADGGNLHEGEVAVLLDVSPRASWLPGALRRIIMNLLGNALKYTPKGWVAVSLRAQESANSQKMNVVFRVVDSGKGMSEDFQKNHLFVPFSQADTFEPGVGLGLSIVKQIIDSLGGTIDIKSVQNVGTEVEVRMSLALADAGKKADEEIAAVVAKTKGLRLCLLDPNGEKQRDQNDNISRLDTTLSEVCWGWFEMEVTKADSLKDVDADVYMYTEPPSVEYLLEHHSVNKTGSKGGRGKEVPLIIVCLNASEALGITANHIKALSDLGRIVEVISQPCGPRKLAKTLSQCIRRVEETFNKPMLPERQPKPKGLPHRSRLEDMGAATMLGLPSMTLPRLNTSEERVESTRAREFIRNTATELPPSTAVAFPTINRSEGNARETQNQTPSASVPHVLCVDDNNINLQLLSMFMKKHKLPYQEAVNGQEALDKYIEYSNSDTPIDFILMDISMPVMNGLESTRRIREFEIEQKMEKKATIIALTGLASAEAQADAEASGVDIYMAKPVKFQALRPLLVNKKA
ncbi:hypothetical protein E4T45_06502 [Aureobasidium sp. EXF-8846]|nr:hypothetical protein E4T45_06502 [Aureobasidium sp. EXF-8846]